MKINTKINNSVINGPDRTTNHENGIAFSLEPLEKLYTNVATKLIGEPKFYKNINSDSKNEFDTELIEDIKAVSKIDPKFVLQLAEYTRNVLNLRTVSIVILVEASLIDECKPFVKEFTPRIIKRADELTEAVAYLQKKIGHIGNHSKTGSMPAALKKGIANSFSNFNEFQFAKYNSDGFVKLKDVLRLTRPKPKNDEESNLYKKILTNTLSTPVTWETHISTKGSTTETWTEIAPKLPIFALIRNLRNLIEKKVDSDIVAECMKVLTDKDKVLRSRILPFRFYTAFREVIKVGGFISPKALNYLETAMDLSVENLPRLKGKTCILVDHSGSMDSKISANSIVSCKDIGDVMGAIAHKISDESIVGLFGETSRFVNVSERDGVLRNSMEIGRVNVGHATFAHLPIQDLIRNKIFVDRILLLSDMQCYTDGHTNSFVEEFLKYKRTVNHNVKLYSFDLTGYGTVTVPRNERNTCLIAGWSERVLEYISLFENDRTTAIDIIKNGKKELEDTDSDNC